MQNWVYTYLCRIGFFWKRFSAESWFYKNHLCKLGSFRKRILTESQFYITQFCRIVLFRQLFILNRSFSITHCFIFQGKAWEHVTSDQPLSSISCGPYKQVWATTKSGSVYWRIGITADKLEGDKWIGVEPPSGSQLKQISVGQAGIWCIDNEGRIHVRKEVTCTFPEGTHWQTIVVDPPVASKLGFFLFKMKHCCSVVFFRYNTFFCRRYVFEM